MNVNSIASEMKNFVLSNIGPNSKQNSDQPLREKRNYIAIGFTVAAVALAIFALSHGVSMDLVILGAGIISPRVGALCLGLHTGPQGAFWIFKGATNLSVLKTLGGGFVLFGALNLPFFPRIVPNVAAALQDYSLEGFALHYFAPEDKAQP